MSNYKRRATSNLSMPREKSPKINPVEEEPTDEEEEELYDEELIAILKTTEPSEVASIISTAHKISKNHITKSAAYQPKIKRALRGPKQVLDSQVLQEESNRSLNSVTDSKELPKNEILELLEYVKRKNIKAEQWKTYFEKLYNYDAAGLDLTKVKRMVNERLDMLRMQIAEDKTISEK